MNIQKKMYILFFSVILSFFMLYCLYPAIEFYIHGYKKLLVSIITLLFCYYVCFKFIISIHSYARVDKVETINFQRLIGMDIIRCVACVLVILVHFIISIGWYNQAPEGGEWFVVAIIRWLAQCCCPLFMILSGYFLSNRTAGIKHLNGLIHFIRNYAFLCIMCVLVNRDYSYESIKNLINLSHYWYIDMYFGLFLLVPFLNILWKYATNQEKNLLVCVLIFLSSVGTVTNHWLTNYWYGLYPIMYYFLGNWLHDYEIKMDYQKIKIIICITIGLCLQALFTFFANYGKPFDWVLNFDGYSCAYNSLPVAFVSVLLVLFFKDIIISNRYVSYVLTLISRNSLEVYLSLVMFLGGISQQFVFAKFGGFFGTWGCFIILIPLELFLSTTLGMLLNKTLNLFQQIIKI